MRAMSKPDLTTPDQAFLQRLKDLPLFQHLGEYSIPETTFTQRRLPSSQEVNKHLHSITWENFTLEARNRLTMYLSKKHPKEDRLWNAITEAYKPELSYFKPTIEKYMREYHLDDAFAHDFDWNILGMCMENHYQKIAPRLPSFFLDFLPLYEAGHIPCGWEGPVQEEYTGKPIDKSAGILLVY
ncbi:hypothetical protein [Hymenobacter cellulosivorans]|uniref:Uncharacterized protein n=1 Tax=Hymenobacter cellulosivorans TaxID=2932249 RepID=A0ABY4FFZ5_9BACT|nr:hypothetical protein [Hymenobacter cellulosivorans]UOQ55549.1 hypothetical protein MUN80_12495 [Hymenobacter cellulosivorans]